MGYPSENRKIAGVSRPTQPPTAEWGPPAVISIIVEMSRCPIGQSCLTSGPMFQQPTRPGWIEVISGVMFSGKSEELIRRVRRAVIARKQVQVFKSHLDARYAGLYNVSTHDGITVEAEPVDSAAEIVQRIRPATEVVAVDEAQFLDEAIVDVANTLADRGVRVILAGTDVDFRGLPFGPMPTVMCIAEVEIGRASCRERV